MPSIKASLPGVPFKLPAVSAQKRQRAAELFALLNKHYGHARCELEYQSPHELLVATILSAQATDVSVNKATPALFKAFPTPSHYAAASPDAIEPFIKTIGLFRNKAKSVFEAMREVHTRFGGQVPRSMDELLTLRGVARKTANVVLGNCFDTNVGFVDTHILRLSLRLGLVSEGAPVAKAERYLMACFADYQSQWCRISHMLIFHGRYACKARGVPCQVHEICACLGSNCELRISAGKAIRRTKAAKRAKPAAQATKSAARPSKKRD